MCRFTLIGLFLLAGNGAALRLAKWADAATQDDAFDTDSELGVESVECHKPDGFGAQLTCQLAAFAHARYLGDCYKYHKFSEGGFHGNSKKFDPQEFTGLQSDDPAKCKNQHKVVDNPSIVKDTSLWYTNEVRDEMRSFYWKSEKPKPEETCDVAFHVRRGDAWASRKTPNDKIAQAIKGVFPDKQVCIVSTGQEKDFGEIQQLKNVKFLLKDQADLSFHRLVIAPEMVVASSAFSYAAGILTKGTVYYLPKGESMILAGMPVLHDWKPIRCASGICKAGLAKIPSQPKVPVPQVQPVPVEPVPEVPQVKPVPEVKEPTLLCSVLGFFKLQSMLSC